MKHGKRINDRMENVGVTLDKDILNKLDETRNKISRGEFVSDLIDDYYELCNDLMMLENMTDDEIDQWIIEQGKAECADIQEQ